MSPTPRRAAARSRALVVALLLAGVTLLLSACGDAEKAATTADGPATLTPADALLYGEVVVRPSGDVKSGAEAAIRQVLRIDDPGRAITDWLDEESDDADAGDFDSEVDPWLGDTLGGFMLADRLGEDPEGALVAAVRDRDEARAALERMRERGETERGGEYRGVTYDLERDDDLPVALVGDFVVFGTEPAFRAAVDVWRGGRPLAGTDRFADAAERVPDDQLLWAFFDGEAFGALFERAAAARPEVARAVQSAGVDRIGTVVASLSARADQLALEVETDGELLATHGGGEGAVGLDDLPGDAWLAAAGPVGAREVEQLFDDREFSDGADALRAATGIDARRDLFSWLAGVGAFLRGTGPLDLGVGVVLGSSDASASQRFVARLQRLVSATGIPTAPTTGEGEGFQLKLPDFPQPVVVLAKDDRVAVSLGLGAARDAVDPPDPFGEEEPGKSAIASLGDGYRPDLVLTVDPLLSLLSTFGLDSDPDFASALPYLRAYRSLAAGSKWDGDRTTYKVVLALRDSGE
jgi:hypothetical protein